ncbi:MAG: hypothetical protein ACLPWS_06810 [Rhodomicrobium sp.]
MLVSAGMSKGKNAMGSRERHGSGSAVRRAWMWVGAFVLVRIAYYVYFEWTNLVHLYEDDDPLLAGAILLGIMLANIILFINAVLRRRIKPALIYAAFFVLHLGSGRYEGEIDLTAKAYFFSAYPGLCPEGQPEPGNRTFVCYKYRFSGDVEALVFNSGDELSRRSKETFAVVDKLLFPNSMIKVDPCGMEIVKVPRTHVYRVSHSCWEERIKRMSK